LAVLVRPATDLIVISKADPVWDILSTLKVYLSPSDQVTIDFTLNRTEIARSLVKQNIRYVLIDKLVIDEFSPDSDFKNAPGFNIFSRGVNDFVDIIKRNGQLIYLTDRFELYRVRNLSAISKEPFS